MSSSYPYPQSSSASGIGGGPLAQSASSVPSSSSSSVTFSSVSAAPFHHQGSSPEEVPFELLHLELVASALSSDASGAKTDSSSSSSGRLPLSTSDLELLGFNAGFRLIERLTRESPKFKDELDLMKFVCKEFWGSVFRKQVDNLRTNHQGVYVLQDNAFRFLSKVSQGRQHLERAPKFVVFTCGLLRGSLANLGVSSVVTAEVVSLPAVKFQVEVQRA